MFKKSKIVDYVRKKINGHKRKAAAFSDYEREFRRNYDPAKPTALLLGFPRKRMFFWREFFGEDRTLALRSARHLRRVLASIDAAKATVYLKGDKPWRAAERVAKAYGASCVRLRRGLIGHPRSASAPACFSKAEFRSSLTPDETEKAARLRSLYVRMGIGYGGSPSFVDTETFLGPCMGERVLVLCAKRKAFRNPFKRPDGRTALVKTALRENPGADVYVHDGGRGKSYAPVPRHMHLDGERRRYWRVSAPVRTTDLIVACDRVYTDCAPAAVDAVFYGKRLIVTGRPFYAGYGLTDDRSRAHYEGRRPLSADEFFGVMFLKGTTFCYGDGDATLGLLATILDVGGHYEAESARAAANAGTGTAALSALCRSERWPALIAILRKGAPARNLRAALKSLSDMRTASPASSRFMRAVSAAFLGAAPGKPYFPFVLSALKKAVPLQDLSAVLQEILLSDPSVEIVREMEALSEEQGKWEDSQALLEYLLASAPAKARRLSSGNPDAETRLARTLKMRRRRPEAERAFMRLLAGGYATRETFFHLGELASSAFAFGDAAALFDVACVVEGPTPHLRALQERARQHYLLGDAVLFAKSVAAALTANPPFIERISLFGGLLNREFGPLPYEEALFRICAGRMALVPKTDAELMALAKAHLAFERFDGQMRLLERVGDSSKRGQAYLSALVDACMFAGDMASARKAADQALRHYPGAKSLRQAAKLAIRTDDCARADALFAEAARRRTTQAGAVINEMLYRKYSFSKGNVREAFASYRHLKLCDLLKEEMRGKYFQSAADCRANAESLLVMACFGPGDEIHFASAYTQMQALFPGKDVAFTCDPRLYPLLARSYPDLRFLAVARLRNLSCHVDLSQYARLPSADLHAFFDNAGWEAACRADAATLSTDLLADALPDKPSFSGVPYLRACPEKTAYWRKRLPRDGMPTIGLSWRSSLTTYSRNEHYVSVRDLKPLLDRFANQVRFVNLQYDDATEELAWIARHTAASVLHFADLDQYNDLDAVAAVMRCMDLTIAPATTVAALAGALGCPTLLLSNSSELHWRKIDERKTDVWHRCTRHAEGDAVGDKASLVRNLAEEVEAFIGGREVLREGVMEKKIERA
jgi:capsular polysaccharide export protein